MVIFFAQFYFVNYIVALMCIIPDSAAVCCHVNTLTLTHTHTQTGSNKLCLAICVYLQTSVDIGAPAPSTIVA